MRRDHFNFLRRWRNDPIRVPLMIRGARQAGKSWLVTTFGREFDHFITINFEKDRRVHALFPAHIDLPRACLKNASALDLSSFAPLRFVKALGDA